MWSWQKLTEDVSVLLNDATIGNFCDHLGHHGWLDTVFFVFAPLLIIPLTLLIDLFSSKENYETLHGKRGDSFVMSKLMQALPTMILQLVLASHRSEIANASNSIFYMATYMPAFACLISSVWYAFNHWPPLTIRLFLCGAVVADFARALGINSIITESVEIRLYSLLAAALNSRHLVWPWDIFIVIANWCLHKLYRLCTSFELVRTLPFDLYRFAHFGLESFSKHSDLPVLKGELEPAGLSRDLQPAWDDEDHEARNAFLKALAKTLFRSAMHTVTPALVCHICQLYLATLISQLIQSISRDTLLGSWRPFLFILKTFVTTFAIMVADAWRVHRTGIFDMKLKGTLSTKILQKVFRLPTERAQGGEPVSMLSVETEQLAAVMPAIHKLWLAPVNLTLSLVVFYYYNGLLMLALLLVLFAALSMAALVVPQQVQVLVEWKSRNQRQLAQILSIVSRVEHIRTLGLENATLRYVKRLRTNPPSLTSYARLMKALGLLSLSLLGGLVPIAIILQFVLTEHEFDPVDSGQIFTTMAIIALMLEPFILFFKEGSAFRVAKLNLRLLQDFLCQDEHQDPRLCIPLAAGAAPQHSYPVTFRSASIAPSTQLPAILSDISISIRPTSLTIVSGPVASGVSLLLKAIVGEAALLAGQIVIRGAESSISYAAQDVWLFGSTIYDAIIAGRDYDPILFRDVAVACMLGYDIDVLKRYDYSLIGPGGSWLNAGLRQRVAIARAAYAEPKVFVMDDLFSSQSAQIACALFERLFGPRGFFKKREVTVILATNSVRHFELADKVIYIDENHQLTQFPSKQAIQSMVKENCAKQYFLQDLDQCRGGCRKPDEGSVHIATFTSGRFREPQLRNDGTVATPGFVSLCRLVPKSFLLEWVLFLILQVAFGRIPELLLRDCIGSVSGGNYHGIWLYGLAIAFRGFFSAAEAYFQVPSQTDDEHEMLLQAFMKKPFEKLSTLGVSWAFHQSPEASYRINGDWATSLRRSIHSSLLMLCDFVIIFSSLPVLLLILPLAVLGVYWIHSFCLRVLRQLRTLKTKTKSDLISAVQVACKQLSSVRGDDQADTHLVKLLSLLKKDQQVDFTSLEINAWRHMCQRAVSGTLVVAITSVSLHAAPSLPRITVGFAFLLASWLWRGIDAMFIAIADTDQYMTTASKINDFMVDIPPPIAVNRLALHRNYKGAVEFEMVRVKRTTPDSSRVIFKNVTCEIIEGENVGVIGRTGSGRTTIFLTLLQQLKYEGSIKIDGIELSTIPQHKHRHIFTSISQRPIDFPGTVRDNIFPWDMATENHEFRSLYTDEEILTLLGELDLREHILARGGLDADVEDMHFTPGQRQLMAIATGCFHHFTHDTKIVLIDESTEVLDAKMDNQAHRLIARVFIGCTKFFFAHRRDILGAMDVFMNLGEMKREFEFSVSISRPPAYATAAEYAEAEDRQPFDDEDIYSP